MNEEVLIEELAAIEHARWAHWQTYLHSQCDTLPDGRLAIPAELVRRWETQIKTPYDQLSEKEKNSDREQVVQILPILSKYFEEFSESG